MSEKPKILVTRRHLAATEERLAADYDAVSNTDDHIMSADELVAGAEGMDALLICVTEPMDAATIERLPDSVRAILTLSVGNALLPNSVGVLDANGSASSALTLPNVPGISGLTLYATAVTMDTPRFPFVRTVFPKATPFTVQ